jgi:hypothetical protein
MRGYVVLADVPTIGNSFAPIALTRKKVVEVSPFGGL